MKSDFRVPSPPTQPLKAWVDVWLMLVDKKCKKIKDKQKRKKCLNRIK